MMIKVASHLLSHIKQLDSHSVLQTLKVCAYSEKLAFRPTRDQLLQIEDKIMINLPEYLKSDLSIALTSLLRLNYYPHAIFTELNQMSKLVIFKKD
jgi:hypothetical protein